MNMRDQIMREQEREKSGVDSRIRANAEQTDFETLQRQRDEYLAGWKRAQADYANLAKDTEKFRADCVKYAAERTLTKLLPAIDQLELALRERPSVGASPEPERRQIATWMAGLEAVRQLWETTAADLGLERVKAAGRLDPSIHEAAAEEAHASVPPGEIIKTVTDGWKLNGKLIRPARVVVSQGPMKPN